MTVIIKFPIFLPRIEDAGLKIKVDRVWSAPVTVLISAYKSWLTLSATGHQKFSKKIFGYRYGC